MRIGFYVTDGFYQAVPACQRAVLLAKAALESRGHTVSGYPVSKIKSRPPFHRLPCRRAVLLAKVALESRGHTVS